MLLGFKPGVEPDGFWDSAEKLPNDYFIIQREITKAVSGKKYFINKFYDGSDKAKPEHLPAIEYGEFFEYYELWENFHYFGYPQGLSWLDARPWFNTVLKRFENAYIQVQNMKDEAAFKSK